ncbi:hypothetical protein TNCV_1913621 [Trichonephila clavipes]|nr:hypothetical protein TNCV_1913621 [Trichonephila clavipes]
MKSSSGQSFIPTNLGRVDEEMIPQGRGCHNCLLVVWSLYFSITSLCVHEEGTALGQSLVQACKERGAGNLPAGSTTTARLFHCNPWPRMTVAYQRAQRVRVIFHPTTTLS